MPSNFTRVFDPSECDYCELTDDGVCADSCECPECTAAREADKDREFDERVAMGYA